MNKEPINIRSGDQATVIKSFFGTLLMILSGLILYADKIINYFNVTFSYVPDYYYDLDAYIWSISQTISPILILFSTFFKPKRWSYLSPLAAFSVQFMYIMRDESIIEKDYFWYYTAVFIIFFYVMIYFLRKGLRFFSLQIRNLKKMVKVLGDFILVEARDKYVAPEDVKEYDEDAYKTLKKGIE